MSGQNWRFNGIDKVSVVFCPIERKYKQDRHLDKQMTFVIRILSGSKRSININGISSMNE